MVELNFDDYYNTPNKLKYLWMGIKKLLGLENELKTRIEELEQKVIDLRKQIYRSQSSTGEQ